jgi:hypothetical protein
MHPDAIGDIARDIDSEPGIDAESLEHAVLSRLSQTSGPTVVGRIIKVWITVVAVLIIVGGATFALSGDWAAVLLIAGITGSVGILGSLMAAAVAAPKEIAAPIDVRARRRGRATPAPG